MMRQTPAICKHFIPRCTLHLIIQLQGVAEPAVIEAKIEIHACAGIVGLCHAACGQRWVLDPKLRAFSFESFFHVAAQIRVSALQRRELFMGGINAKLEQDDTIVSV